MKEIPTTSLKEEDIVILGGHGNKLDGTEWSIEQMSLSTDPICIWLCNGGPEPDGKIILFPDDTIKIKSDS